MEMGMALNTKTNELTTVEVASLLNCTPRTIVNMVKSGKLSARRDSVGNYKIDKSEFYRAFPDAFKEESKGNDEKSTESVSEDSEKIALEAENKYLKELLLQKDRMNELLLNQLQNANHEKGRLIDTLSSSQRLLEHESDNKKKKKFLGVFG